MDHSQFFPAFRQNFPGSLTWPPPPWAWHGPAGGRHLGAGRGGRRVRLQGEHLQRRIGRAAGSDGVAVASGMEGWDSAIQIQPKHLFIFRLFEDPSCVANLKTSTFYYSDPG